MPDIQKIARIRERLTQPLVFIGMMGAGKTTLARKVSETLARPFFDSDLEIEKEEGCPVSDIFSSKGEKHFRLLEERKISQLLEKRDAILSVGGGAIVSPHNSQLILSKSLCLWLDASIDILAKRTGDPATRPLLAGGDVKTRLQEKMDQRRVFYEKAHIRVDGSPSIEKVAENVLGQVYRYLLEISP